MCLKGPQLLSPATRQQPLATFLRSHHGNSSALHRCQGVDKLKASDIHVTHPVKPYVAANTSPSHAIPEFNWPLHSLSYQLSKNKEVPLAWAGAPASDYPFGAMVEEEGRLMKQMAAFLRHKGLRRHAEACGVPLPSESC